MFPVFVDTSLGHLLLGLFRGPRERSGSAACYSSTGALPFDTVPTFTRPVDNQVFALPADGARYQFRIKGLMREGISGPASAPVS